MIASSAAWSTSETKSFFCLLRMVSLSTSNDARLMRAPALRAALTAVLSMGCMREFYYGPLHRPCQTQPPGQYRRRGARDEDHGFHRPTPGGAEVVSCAGGPCDGVRCGGPSRKREVVR